MLAAFRLCGEIDLDGGGEYDEEAGTDLEPEDEYDDEYEGSESDRRLRRINLSLDRCLFPIRKHHCDDEYGGEESECEDSCEDLDSEEGDGEDSDQTVKTVKSDPDNSEVNDDNIS